MSCIHYKFKSSLEYDTLTFDGLHISLADLKKAIIEHKKLGKSGDFHLQITDAQTKQAYVVDSELIPRNASVIVTRVPIGGVSIKSKIVEEALKASAAAKQPQVSKSSNVSFQNSQAMQAGRQHSLSEEDKILSMMQESTKDYDPSRYVKSAYTTGRPYRNYVCRRCGQSGHFIVNCPQKGEAELKRNTGIPKEFLTVVSDPTVPGAKRTTEGYIAVPTIDRAAYAKGKKEKPPFLPSEEAMGPIADENKLPIPGELICLLCKGIMKDAVVIPCCGTSFCDECVRDALMASEDQMCPMEGCGELDVTPNSLIPNKFLRTAITNFLNDSGYAQVKKKMQEARENSPSLNNSPQVQPKDVVVPSPKKDNRPTLPDITIPFDLVGLPPQVIQAKLRERDLASKPPPQEDDDDDDDDDIMNKNNNIKNRRSPLSLPRRPNTPTTPTYDEDLFPVPPKYIGESEDTAEDEDRDDDTPPPPPPKPKVHLEQGPPPQTVLQVHHGPPPPQMAGHISQAQPILIRSRPVIPSLLTSAVQPTASFALQPGQVVRGSLPPGAVINQLPSGARTVVLPPHRGMAPMSQHNQQRPPLAPGQHMGYPGIGPPGTQTHQSQVGMPGPPPIMGQPPPHQQHPGYPPQRPEYMQIPHPGQLGQPPRMGGPRPLGHPPPRMSGPPPQHMMSGHAMPMGQQIRGPPPGLGAPMMRGPPPPHGINGPHPVNQPGPKPPVLSEEEFYRRKRLLREEEKRPTSVKRDGFDEFARDNMKREKEKAKKRDAYDDFLMGLEKRDRDSKEKKDIQKHVKEQTDKLLGNDTNNRELSDNVSRIANEKSRSRSRTPGSKKTNSPVRREAGTPRKGSRTPKRGSRSPLRKRSFSRSPSQHNRTYSSRSPPPRKGSFPRSPARKRSYSRSLTPRKRSTSRKRSFSRSPRRTFSRSPRRSVTPRKRSFTPRKRMGSGSPRNSFSGGKRSRSPRKRSLTPRKRSLTPRKRSLTPRKRSLTPRKRSLTPRKRNRTPNKRSLTPRKRSRTPNKRSLTPRKRSLTPRRRSLTPKRRPYSRTPSPKRRSFSRSPGRKRSRTPLKRRTFSKSPKKKKVPTATLR